MHSSKGSEQQPTPPSPVSDSNPAAVTLSSTQLPDTIDPAVAVVAFQSQRDVLLEAICSCLTTLANKLLAKFVITSETLEKACNERNGSVERAVYLLSCVQKRIKTEPADFIKVVDILESEPTLTRHARLLVDSYCNPSAVSITDPFKQFSRDLKAMYKCSPIILDKWPPTPCEEYIKLAVVESHDVLKEDYIGRVVIGKVFKRRNLSEEQILDLCVEQVGKGRVIVIEGAPGIGKTTLAWELCRKWEEHASMKAYSLVILLQLREKRVHEINDVSSLFYAYDGEDKVSIVKKIKESQGKGILFVLDGFDELPKSLQHEGVLVNLLKKRLLPECTAIVTSRPSVMDRLLTICRPVIVKRIEILGFTHESVVAFINNSFSLNSSREGFISFISGNHNPAIASLMYVPLYAAFIVIIYKSTTSRGSLPHTITQLYTQLCLTVLNRYLEANTEYSSVQTVQDLPDTLYSQFLELSKLAYEGFEEENFIFYSKISEHFGFLHAVPDLYGGRGISYNFLHFTLQEFFAAYHISQMPDSGVELFCKKGYDMRWNVVWRFVAGLTKFKYLNKSSVRAFSEADGVLNYFFVQCLFEAQSVKLAFSSIFGQKSMLLYSRSDSSLDYYALGYCIANCTTRESSWKIEIRETSSYRPRVLPLNIAIQSFTQGLKTCEVSTGVIALLHIYPAFQFNNIECLRDCAELSPLHSVTDLHIGGANLMSNNKKICLFQLILRMPHLQKLCIYYCHFRNAPHSYYLYHRDKGTDGLLKLLQYLPRSKVTSLDIVDTGLDYFMEESPLSRDYSAAFQALVNPPSGLKDLCIGHCFSNSYCREGSRTLSSLASSSSSLKKLSFCLRHDSSLLNAFKRNSHITELEIVHFDPQIWTRFLSDITKITRHSTGLKKLTLAEFFNDRRDTHVLRTIATALQRNKNLKQLCVSVWGGDEKLQRRLQAIDSRISLGLKKRTYCPQPLCFVIVIIIFVVSLIYYILYW